MRRKPTSPGEILREEFLSPMNLTQKDLAQHINCDIKVINRIVNARSAITVEIAIKLASALRTSPEFWLNAQRSLDLYNSSTRLKNLPKPILARKMHGGRAA